MSKTWGKRRPLLSGYPWRDRSKLVAATSKLPCHLIILHLIHLYLVKQFQIAQEREAASSP